MAVLVCGGAGYIGSHVNKELYKEGYETVVFDSLCSGHRQAVKWGNLAVGDLKDPKEIEAVFEKYRIDAVMHFAAYAYVGESVREPEKYYYNNIVNTLNLLGAMKRHGCRKIVFSSTCATYGEAGGVPITEGMCQRPISPYGKSKLAVEHILRDYQEAYGLQPAVLRYFNAAGADPEGEVGEAHEPETHLIPLVLEAAGGEREDIKVFGLDHGTPDGSCIRDYVHVADLAAAHLAALHSLEEGKGGGFFNLGNGKGVSVLEVVRSVEKVTGKKVKVTVQGRRPGDPAVLVADSRKAREVLGWRPQYTDIDVMVEHAWNFHKHKF